MGGQVNVLMVNGSQKMKRSEFIEEAYRRADKAGRIDDERVIKFYLDMFLDMGMLPPTYKVKHPCKVRYNGKFIHEGSIEYFNKWELEEEIEATGAQGAEGGR